MAGFNAIFHGNSYYNQVLAFTKTHTMLSVDQVLFYFIFFFFLFFFFFLLLCFFFEQLIHAFYWNRNHCSRVAVDCGIGTEFIFNFLKGF